METLELLKLFLKKLLTNWNNPSRVINIGDREKQTTHALVRLMNTDKLQQRQQTLINLITRVGGRQNIQKWMDELLKIDIDIEQEKTMKKATSYKGYQLKSSGVYFEGKLLPEDNWCLSAEYGVVLLNEKDADFDPNFELGYDLSHISLTAAEEKQYKNLLPLQRRVEESIKNNEWQYKATSYTEQDIGGDRTTVYTRWEHPEFGVFEKTYDSQQLTVPTEYSAEYFKAVCLNVHRAAMLRVLRFQAWVDYWENIDSQPKVDTYADAKAAAVEKLKNMGVPAELIDVGDKFIFVKGAKASFYKGKEVFHSLDVWYSHWDDVKITPEQVQAAHKFLYSEYKKNQAGKPCKSFEKWLATFAA